MASQDPLESFLSYISDVKPYHTKVYEIVLAYTYSEPVNTTVVDTMVIHTTIFGPGVTLPNGTVIGGNNNICDGIGWDTLPFDTAMWDYPYDCNISILPVASVTITEAWSIDITEAIYENILGLVIDEAGGWDTQQWDIEPWDLQFAPEYTVTDTDADTNSASISEVVLITMKDLTSGVTTTYSPTFNSPGG